MVIVFTTGIPRHEFELLEVFDSFWRVPDLEHACWAFILSVNSRQVLRRPRSLEPRLLCLQHLGQSLVGVPPKAEQ